MSYKLNFDSLDSFCNSIRGQANTWQTELSELQGKIEILIGSSNMSGAAAQNIKSYLENVHTTLIGLLAQLISLHANNCLLYKNDYQTNIDQALHAVIYSSEISDYKKQLEDQKKTAVNISEEVNYALDRVKDIFSVGASDITSVDEAHKSAITFLTELDNDIKELEKRHSSNDFTSASEMISALKQFIAEQMAGDRTYKSNFDIYNLASSESFRKLVETQVKISGELKDKMSAIETAIENEDQRVAALEQEYKERQETANLINWIVAGVCIVGSVVAIVATAGAATPLVVGSISAVSGAVMAGTGNLTSQYVKHGNIIENADEIDWGSFGKDVVIAGMAGFVTGYVGAGMSGVITSKLGGSAIGNNLLHSTNTVTRIGTNAVIGGASEVGAGIVSRGAGTFIASEGDMDQVLREAFDPGNIALDATLGGANGAVMEIGATRQAQKAADNAASTYNNRYDPFDAGQQAGLTNLKQTKNGGVDFSESDYILKTDVGEPIEIKIKSTGNRRKDYELAEKILKEEHGINIDFKSMRTGTRKTHVWHHMDDYNVMTNECTLQFIDIDAHSAIANHSGAASQYHIAHGTGYGKQAIDTNYEGNGFLDYLDPVLDNISEAQNNRNNIYKPLYAN